MHIGIVGYCRTGNNKVFTRVVFNFGVKLLNLFIWVRIPLLLFIVLVIWPTNPAALMLKPSNFPLLQVSISLPLTVIFLDLN